MSRLPGVLVPVQSSIPCWYRKQHHSVLDNRMMHKSETWRQTNGTQWTNISHLHTSHNTFRKAALSHYSIPASNKLYIKDIKGQTISYSQVLGIYSATLHKQIFIFMYCIYCMQLITQKLLNAKSMYIVLVVRYLNDITTNVTAAQCSAVLTVLLVHHPRKHSSKWPLLLGRNLQCTFTKLFATSILPQKFPKHPSSIFQKSYVLPISFMWDIRPHKHLTSVGIILERNFAGFL